MTVSVARDALFVEHDPGFGHPECPERLIAIEKGLEEAPLELVEIAVRPATVEECVRVHDRAHIDHLVSLKGRPAILDPDTRASEASIDAAFMAAGAAIELAKSVCTKAAPPGMALVRPPGHHATKERAMGFCFINNVAVAARALIEDGLAERVLIYDFDVHHGNGTEDIFYDDKNVLYMSTHQWPFYPGTGARDRTGGKNAEGSNLNVPLPAGTGDEDLLTVNKEILLPKARAFAPDVILLSAGFDPFELDPIGGFRVTVQGFRTLCGLWRDLADDVSSGRIAAVLEGGYHLAGLSDSVHAVLELWS